MFRPGLILAAFAAVATAQPEAQFAEAERLLKAGNYSQAVRDAESAAAGFAADGRKDGMRRALSVAGAASVYQGEYRKAIGFFERALRADRELGDVPGEVLRLNNLGGVYSFLGRYGEAHEAYRSALDRLKGQEAEPWFGRSRQLSLGNLGILYLTLGQDARALDLYREIRGGPMRWEPSVEAQLLTNLAIVYRRLGDPRKALETYQQARRLFDRDPHAAGLLGTLRNIGVVEARDLDDPGAALRTFGEALRLAKASGNRREMVQELLFLGEALTRLGKFGEAEARLSEALREADELKLVDERWIGLAGLARAHRGMGRREEAVKEYEQAIAVIEASRAGLSAGLRDEFLAGKRDVYDELVALLLERPEPPVADIFLRMEQGRARNLKDSALSASPAPMAAAQRELGGDEALVEYWITDQRLAVLWMTRDGSGLLHRELTAGDLEAARALTRSLQAAGKVARLDEVSRLVFGGELSERLGSMKRVAVVADGWLHGIPFEVLRGQDGRMMVERFEISYLPSAQLRKGERRPAWRWPWQTSVSAFADPIVPAGESFDQAWVRLPRSGEEARAVSAAVSGRGKLFVGEANRKARFLDPANRASPILHLATHAAVDVRDSRRSRLIFTPEAGAGGTQYLYREEIAGLDLGGVELVTLSACETEQGRSVRGEGLEGFGRAFLAAGAASTVGSLWKVSDRAAFEFMRIFYGHLGAGMTKAAALRRTKLDLVASGGILAQPYHWAPYVLMGDAHSPALRVVQWWWIAGPGVLAGIGGLAVRRRRRAAN